MADTLSDMVRRYFNQGFSALQIKKKLDQDGYNISWYEVKYEFNKLLTQQKKGT